MVTKEEIRQINQMVKDGTHSLILSGTYDDQFCGTFTTVAKLLEATSKPPPLFTEEEWGAVPSKTWLTHPKLPYYQIPDDTGFCYPICGKFGEEDKYLYFFAYLCPVDIWV